MYKIPDKFGHPINVTRATRGVADGGGGVAGVTTPALLKTAWVDPQKFGYLSIVFLETYE